MRTLTIPALALFWGATATAAEVKAEYPAKGILRK
jgi:hypothetical protein